VSCKPPPRCICLFRCDCSTLTVEKGVPVTWSRKRLRPVAPKAPVCLWCGEPMKRDGTSYQGLLSASWDSETGRSRTRAMFSMMLGRV
jgi:hypothetical protein